MSLNCSWVGVKRRSNRFNSSLWPPGIGSDWFSNLQFSPLFWRFGVERFASCSANFTEWCTLTVPSAMIHTVSIWDAASRLNFRFEAFNLKALSSEIWEMNFAKIKRPKLAQPNQFSFEFSRIFWIPRETTWCHHWLTGDLNAKQKNHSEWSFIFFLY